MKILNQKGLTLIEILATVVILMIVIVGFLSFFSQATSHSRITEDKLTAINLAEKVMVERKGLGTKIINREIKKLEDINGKTYYAIIGEDSTNNLNLQLFFVEIYTKNPENPQNSNEKPITELYSYLNLENE
ncbi:prepilin-type N-terminal cleavage/methylation domain-containing protein [Psychrobacillus sp. NPDC096426]|uniref:type IV pilus modification PilV family protein n=1 Tax=Psychrobacillus sp. NPDC096426 TaxID=3364491 RepID=UPI00381571DB